MMQARSEESPGCSCVCEKEGLEAGGQEAIKDKKVYRRPGKKKSTGCNG